MVLQIFRKSRPAPPEAKASAAAPVVAFHGAGRVAWSSRDSATLTRVGFLQNPVAFRCVKIIAEAAGAVPVVVQDDDRRFDVHPVIDLLAAPNPGQGGAALMESFYGFLLLTGDGYLEAAGMGAGGGPRELYVLRSDRMKVVPGTDGWPVAYEYSAGGSKHVFDMRQDRVPVLHVKSFHPQDDHYGLSPLNAAASAIDVHNSASTWSKALLDNAARPSGAIVYKGADGQGALGPDQYERLVEELESHHQGARNAGRPMLLEGGLDWKPMGFSPSRHGVSPDQGGGGARRGARLRGAADAARAAGRQHLCELRGGAPGVLPADGAAAGRADAGGDVGLAAGVLRRAVPAQGRLRQRPGAGRGARDALAADQRRRVPERCGKAAAARAAEVPRRMMRGTGARGGGSRFLYEPFDAAAARIEVNERIQEERWQQLERRLTHIEVALDRLEKRIWLAVYGAASLILADIAYGLLSLTVS